MLKKMRTNLGDPLYYKKATQSINTCSEGGIRHDPTELRLGKQASN